MDFNEEIAHRLAQVNAQIAHAAAAAMRPVPRLVAVSKRHPATAIEAAYAAGQRDFWENLAPEMCEKMLQLKHLPEIRWHFLGRIQRNKAKHIATAAVVHGVGSVPHAEALARQVAAADNAPPEMFLQVNVSAEPQKNGFEISEIAEGVKAVSTLRGVRLVGLMCVPAQDRGPEGFATLAGLGESLRASFVGGQARLSMGMSGDFPEAIAAGATDVRIGTAIFGLR